MFTFRTSLTFAVMAFIVALAVLLIAIQILALRWATHEAASAYMDATSAKALGRLRVPGDDPAIQRGVDRSRALMA